MPHLILRLSGLLRGRCRLRVIFSLALLLRLLAVALLHWRHDLIIQQGFFSSAGAEFTYQAAGLVAGRGLTLLYVQGQYVPSAFQPPVYAWLLAGLFKTLGHGELAYVAAQIAQCFVGAWACIGLYWVGREIFSAETATLAAFLGAIYPPLVYVPAEIHPLGLTILVTLGFVLVAVRLARRPNWGLALSLGGLGGLLALLRSEAALLAPLTILWSAWGRLHRAWRYYAVSALLGLALLTPWLVRNRLVLGRWVLTTTTGYNLWRGQGALATGSARNWDGQAVGVTPELEQHINALPWSADYELQIDALLSAAAWDYIRAHPLNWLRLTPAKLFFFWGVDLTHPRARHILYWGPSLILALLAGLGWRSAHRAALPRYTLLLIWPLVYTGLTLLFFALPRYRLYAEPFVVLLAAHGLLWLWQRRPGRFSADQPLQQQPGRYG